MSEHNSRPSAPREESSHEQCGQISGLIDELKQRIGKGESVSIGLIQRAAGGRAAGPILLVPSLVVVSPLSAIPGLPTLVAINTFLVAGQVALGRTHLWLPQWLTKRELPPKYGAKLVKFLGRAGQVADNVVKPRARMMVGPPIRRLGAGVCVAVACVMPVLEVVPFTSTWAAMIIAVYALAITAQDGFLVMVWFVLVTSVLYGAWLILA